MSRRETVVNTLLGMVLLITAVLIFLLFVAAAWLGISAIKYLADLFLPGVVLPAFAALFAIYGVCSLAAGVRHLRRRLWRNAFLCFAVIPVIAFAYFASPFLPSGTGSFVSLWFIFIMLFTPEQSLIPRLEFFLAALVVSAFVIAASGLVGSGKVFYMVANFARLAAFAVIVIQVRRRQKAAESRQTASPIVA